MNEEALERRNEEYFNELVEFIDRNLVVPFVGAGLSVPIYPTWNKFFSEVLGKTLIRPSAKEEIETLLAKNEYEKVASRLERALRNAGYVNMIKNTFSESKITNDTLDHMAISLLPFIFRDNTVITTNFDRLLNRVFEDSGYRFKDYITPYEVSKVVKGDFRQGTEHYLLKFHGDYLHADKIVFTEEQYNECYGENLDSPYISFLTNVLSSKVLLFLGCSLETDRTIKLLEKIALDNHRTHYAIIENPSDTLDDIFFDKEEQLSDIGIKCIWYPKDMHKKVRYYLDEIKKK